MADIPLFGPQKHCTLVGIGRATLAAAVALPRQGNQNFPEINYVLKREKKNTDLDLFTLKYR